MDRGYVWVSCNKNTRSNVYVRCLKYYKQIHVTCQISGEANTTVDLAGTGTSIRLISGIIYKIFAYHYIIFAHN